MQARRRGQVIAAALSTAITGITTDKSPEA
jgi:hypothetical protein